MPKPYSSSSLLRLHVLALILSLALAHTARADDTDETIACPVGVLKCPKKSHKNEYSLCKRNDLLDFYEPGLPAEGDRSKAPGDMSSRKVLSPDGTHYQLEGDVRLQRLDQLLRSDFLLYDTETSDYTANGNVRMQDRSMLLAADHARGTVTPNSTYLDNTRYQLLGQRGNGTAATANMTDPDHGKMTDGTYSTCDPSDRRWYIHGKEMEMDQVNNEARAHDATFYYGDVPIFWFPYVSFPISDDRESGFLVPHVGYTTRRGLVLGFPYYLNLAPNYDATLEPRLSTERGAMLEGQFRYLDETGKLQLDFNYVPHDNEVDEEIDKIASEESSGEAVPVTPLDIPLQRYEMRLQGAHLISSNWVAQIDVNRVSDKQYFQDYGDNLTTSATSLLTSTAFIGGRGEWWTASFGVDAAQITQPTLSEAYEPYARLPHAALQAEHPVLGDLVAGLDADYANFRRGSYDVFESASSEFQSFESIEGQRLDMYPYLAYPIETAGYFFRPELGLRYTSYDLSNLDGYAATNPGAPQFTNRTPSRSVPIFSVDAGLIFDRDTDLFGQALTQTLEPRLYYLRVPYRNQNDLPIFDTQLPTFDFPSLFRSNTFVGADRQTNANNLTAAITTRMIDTASGDQLLSASLGQIRYFDPQRVQLPGQPEVDFSGSDYVGELDLRLNDRWEFKWDQQYNPNSKVVDPATAMLVENMHHTDLSAVSVEHRFGGDGVFDFSYRFRRNLLEQVDTAVLYPLNERWALVGRYYYSLVNNQLLEAFAGAEYDSCCVALRVLVRRYVNTVGAVNTSTGLYFELEFKGLGNTGTRTENFLRRAILGYE